jgi:hypothetical protein
MACPQCHSILRNLYYEYDNDKNDLMMVWKCGNCDLNLVVHYPAEHSHIKKINDVESNITMAAFTKEMRKKHLKLGIVHEYNMAEHMKEETEKATDYVEKGHLGLPF